MSAIAKVDEILEIEKSSADLFNYQQIRDYVGFVWGAVKRHRVLCSLTVVGMVSMTFAAAKYLPRTYHAESKLLAVRNQIIASLGNPGRMMPSEADAPTRAAYETVLRRDNLISLVKQTNLIDQWESTRAPVMRVKDQVFRYLIGEISEEDKMNGLVGTLERALYVNTGEGTVQIGIDWPDARLAFELVEAAQQNFLEARHVAEVSAISEAISILEVHAGNEEKSVDVAMDNLQKVMASKRKSSDVRQQPTPTRSRPLMGDARDQELAQLKFTIRAKRRAIADLEESRNRRLTELQAQLADQRVIYSPQHPIVVDLQQRISAMGRDSPQLAALKRDETEMSKEYTGKGGRDVNALTESKAAPKAQSIETAIESSLSRLTSDLLDDPEVAVAMDQLRMASAKFQDLTRRIDAAKIELDTARAAFKYRYSVISPAAIPKDPSKPKMSLVIGGGLFASLTLSLFFAVALDIWRGRIVEPWQVERFLKIPVLAEVTRD